MMEQLIKWLEEKYPNKVPTYKMSEWELGVLAGERMLIEDIKIKLNVEEIIVDDVIV